MKRSSRLCNRRHWALSISVRGRSCNKPSPRRMPPCKEEEAEIRRLQAAVDFFLTELRRTETLARAQTASAQALDRARYDATTNEAALASAKAQLEVRRSIRESLDARLLDPASSALPSNSVCCV